MNEARIRGRIGPAKGRRNRIAQNHQLHGIDTHRARDVIWSGMQLLANDFAFPETSG
jgi:hypothetical protein